MLFLFSVARFCTQISCFIVTHDSYMVSCHFEKCYSHWPACNYHLSACNYYNQIARNVTVTWKFILISNNTQSCSCNDMFIKTSFCSIYHKHNFYILTFNCAMRYILHTRKTLNILNQCLVFGIIGGWSKTIQQP